MRLPTISTSIAAQANGLVMMRMAIRGVTHSNRGRRSVSLSRQKLLFWTYARQQAYSFNPLANINSDKAHLVLGGEHLLWSEQSGPENLDSTVWPRAASSAEVFWTGAKLSDGNATSTSEVLARMHDMRYRFVRRGIKAIALQPHWCAIRPHACDLTV